MIWLEFLATIAGIAGTMSFFLQGYKIYKRKRAGDVSKTMYFIILPGAFIWLIYGIRLRSAPLIITEIIMIAAASLILILSYIYKHSQSAN